jgi:two-component system, response regulator PdtaR
MPNTHNILLVEDDGIQAGSLVEDLHQLGYAASAVNSGEKALAAIAEEPPELVLMDIKLKGELDGIQASARVNREYGIPVIYLTAHSERSILERAKVTEPFGYLIKPVGKSDLSSAIEMALYKSAAERERTQLIAQLQRALAEVKTLKGLLPICSYCKKIRDARGEWQWLEKYVTDHSTAKFTHGICPDCLARCR